MCPQLREESSITNIKGVFIKDRHIFDEKRGAAPRAAPP